MSKFNEEQGKKYLANFSPENYAFLLELKKDNGVGINRILNETIAFYREASSRYIRFLPKNKNYKFTHELRKKFTDEEYEFLQNEAKNHGFKSATQEAKFRLLNTIYEHGFLDNIELDGLRSAVNSVSKIASNVNAVARQLQIQDNKNYMMNYKEFAEVLEKFLKLAECIDDKFVELQSELKNRMS